MALLCYLTTTPSERVHYGFSRVRSTAAWNCTGCCPRPSPKAKGLRWAIHGLQAVLVYAELETAPDQVILHVDNAPVAKVLSGTWVADKLRPYDQMATEVISELEALGIEFFVDHVPERHVHHRAAHRLSKNAWNQLFYEMRWRPPPRPPARPWSPPSSTRPGAEIDFTD